MIVSPGISPLSENSLKAKIGTLGAGVEGSYRWNDKFKARFGISGFSIDLTDEFGSALDRDKFEEVNITPTAKVSILSIGLLGDYHPFGNGFFLSAGAMYNENKFEIIPKTEKDNVSIGEVNFSKAQLEEMRIKMHFARKVAPFLGFGCDYNLDDAEEFGFNVLLGAMFHGKFNISLSGFSDVFSEQQKISVIKRLNEDFVKLNSIKVYPVIEFGFSYNF